MQQDVFMAGFGGQGVLLIGNLLAYAAILDGKNASYFPAYGVEKRGGAATCTVVMDDEEVGSPVVGRFQSALLLNTMAVEKFLPRVAQGGFALINSSLVEPQQVPQSQDMTQVLLPLNELAVELGNPRFLNMVALGAYVEHSQVVSFAGLESALEGVLPAHNHRFIPQNVQALQRGAQELRRAVA